MPTIAKGSKVVVMNGQTLQKIALVQSIQDNVITLEDGTQYGRDGNPIKNGQTPWELHHIVPYTDEAEAEIIRSHRMRELKKAMNKFLQGDEKKITKQKLDDKQVETMLDILSPGWKESESKYRLKKCRS